MRAHAQLAEALRHKEFLGAIDARKTLWRQLFPVREARGQASERRLVPCRQAERPGERADVGLAEPCLVQRAHDGELAKRPVPRAVVAVVVEVRAVDNKGEAMLCREFLHVREQCVFAVVAAVFGVLADMRHREDWERHGMVLDALFLAEGPGVVDIALRHKVRGRGERHRFAAEHIVRHLDEQGRVDAAREGHGDTAELLQDDPQLLVLLAHGLGERLYRVHGNHLSSGEINSGASTSRSGRRAADCRGP